MGNIQTVGPNEAMIISGGWCGGATRRRIVIGGWGWIWCGVQDVQSLSLNIFSLKPKCESVETAQGVPLCVTGIAQCKIMTEKEFLELAAEQFLGMSVKQIKSVLLETLEGHLRAILGTLSVEEIYQDRDKFASLVREVATPDVGRMGIEIVSFTIKDIYDEVNYLSCLGRSRVAEVKRDAQMGVATSERDAGIMEAEAEKESMNVKYTTDSQIGDSERSYLLEKSQYESEVNKQQAETKLAYLLRSTTLNQMIRNEQKQVDLIQRTKAIAIDELEVERKQKELECLIELPASAEAFRVEQTAHANKNAKLAKAEAEATRITMIGEAEAERIRMIGEAQAKAMQTRADALSDFNDVAVMSQILEMLPEFARSVAQPLSKTKEIVINHTKEGTSNDLANGLNSLFAQVPPSIKALTGVDLNKFLNDKFSTASAGDQIGALG